MSPAHRNLSLLVSQLGELMHISFVLSMAPCSNSGRDFVFGWKQECGLDSERNNLVISSKLPAKIPAAMYKPCLAECHPLHSAGDTWSSFEKTLKARWLSHWSSHSSSMKPTSVTGHVFTRCLPLQCRRVLKLPHQKKSAKKAVHC